MNRIQINADATFDGEYEIDFEERMPTGTELHLFKQIAGVLPADLEDAIARGDYDVVVSMAIIALRRANKITKAQIADAVEVLLEAPVGCMTTVPGEGDAGPPVMSGDNEGSPVSSGPTSNTSSGRRDSIPQPIGGRG